MKALGEAFFAFGIEYLRDKSRGTLGLSQKTYLDWLLKKFNKANCSRSEASTSKRDRLKNGQSLKNDIKFKSMLNKLYASLLGSLMYVQEATSPYTAFAVSVLRSISI